MTDKEAVGILDKTGTNYIVLNDREYDPIEIIFLMDAVPKSLNRKVQRSYFTDEAGRKRILVLKTYKEAGLAGWYHKIGKKEKELSSEDIAFLWLHIAYCLSNRECWLRKNIISLHMKKFGVDETGTERFFTDYTLKNGFKIGRIDNTIYSEVIGDRIIGLSKVRSRIYKKMCLLKMRAYYKYKYYRIAKDKRNLSEDFVARLLEDNVINDSIDNHDRKSFNSRSGGSFITYREGENKYFLKGNEPGPLRSIKNESTVQRRIIDSNEDKDNFILMRRHAEDGFWIEFPFVPFDTLDDFLKKRSLDSGSVEMLGRFLCSCVDTLYRLNIVHNDLRGTNIMAVTDESGCVAKFLLLDFGAASMDGRAPWDVSIYEGRYLIRNVCGDYRYNEFEIDDAASALILYLEAGGSIDDEYAKLLRSKIGRLYYSIEVK